LEERELLEEVVKKLKEIEEELDKIKERIDEIDGWIISEENNRC